MTKIEQKWVNYLKTNYKSRRDFKNKNPGYHTGLWKNYIYLLDKVWTRFCGLDSKLKTQMEIENLSRKLKRRITKKDSKVLYGRLVKYVGTEWRFNYDKEFPKSLVIWNDQLALENAKNYKTLIEWIKAKPSSYQYAKKNKTLFKECKESMRPLKDMYSYEKCKELIKKTPQLKQFRARNPGAYKAILRKDYNDLLKLLIRVNYDWTNDEIKKDALKYKSRQEWDTNSSACQLARKRGIIEQCCLHMTPPKTCKRLVYCYQTKKRYKSASEADRVLNLGKNGVYNAIKHYRAKNGYTFKYVEEK